MEWQLTPQWEQVKAQLAKGEQNDSYALILDSQLPQDLPIEIVKKYQFSTFIVRILSKARGRSQTRDNFSLFGGMRMDDSQLLTLPQSRAH